MLSIEPLQTPAYVCEERLLEKNLKTLSHVKQQSGAKIILALKGFAMWSTFNLVGSHLDGCTASGLHEATLAFETMHKEVHTYAPAFKAEEIEQIAAISDHIVFNSTAQLLKFKDQVKKINPEIKISLRINPEQSESPVNLYNPCGLYSRLGTTLKNFDPSVIPFLDGLNFHALCEQGADALDSVLKAFEEKFSRVIDQVDHVNFGGGHHITKAGYDIEHLIDIIKSFKKRHNHIDVYLEPGEAVGWKCGYLVSTVLDIVDNGMKIAILDTSAEAHMPDTLAMPYRAEVRGADEAGKKAFTYRLAGNTCLAGDIMGDYAFDKPLTVGDQIIFEDQIHYTFVKNTTFNGIRLPALMIKRKDGTLELVKSFGYEDYKNRLS
jgi:carboxynorspermidine decarboxylase